MATSGLVDAHLTTQSAYPSARAAALAVLPHFQLNVPIDLDAVAAIVDAAFWASLQREEGRTPKISLAYVAPDRTSRQMIFDHPLPVRAQALTRLAPAVERPGIHLGVWREDGNLFVWGATRDLPPFCFVLEVIAPGLLVIKQSREEESGKFLNIAVIEGDQIKVVSQRGATAPDCPACVASLLGIASHAAPSHTPNPLIQLAISMRAHGRGGSLLVVPGETSAWQESILTPITYAVVPPFSALADLMEADEDARPHSEWQDAFRRAVDGIAGLTAVDGATVVSARHHLLAFGAKIIPRRGSAPVDRVIVTEPIEGTTPAIVEPAQLGGTRHLSAAQFVFDQRDTIALVASQDGRFTVFGWSPREDMVHAHRIETLLL